mmetsp:Transcript_13740/g.17927  ORF Transcript_13740/g.17927 Transcript_13740/m.17927 type:complete len:262 (+) Transcript_13740:80-865(+)|eukprot:CAMPEP_0198140884 /NCGR_PEP_ID=MMETSP1443-20131203/3966_1 /TAXON_ID=186043 /ORGANISM="Entomoneis sp., Strain CCMP2396" /LENGTH=261 /DNA_ID=CAMNT_0043803447 /DNA_START=102 /DNA_END=887 /DNA_ORIENTATION=+
MKFVIAFVALFGLAAAKAPQLSISVRDGAFDGLDGLDPQVSWESNSNAGDFDVSYGASASIRPTTDIASLPRNVWGKVSTSVSGWGVSARAESKGLDFRNADVEVDADNEGSDVNVHLVANAGSTSILSVEATKGLDLNGARVTVNPRFNIEKDEQDVVVNYTKEKTNVKLTASVNNQEVTLSQQLDDNNRVAPTINSNGDLSLEYERKISDDSSLTANLKPNDNLNVEWKDAAWTANIDMPIEGANINGANVSIKRDVSF